MKINTHIPQANFIKSESPPQAMSSPFLFNPLETSSKSLVGRVTIGTPDLRLSNLVDQL